MLISSVLTPVSFLSSHSAEAHSRLSSLLSTLPSPCCYKPLRGRDLINKTPSNTYLLPKTTRWVKTPLPTPRQKRIEHYGILIQCGQLFFVTFVWNKFKPGID